MTTCSPCRAIEIEAMIKAEIAAGNGAFRIPTRLLVVDM